MGVGYLNGPAEIVLRQCESPARHRRRMEREKLQRRATKLVWHAIERGWGSVLYSSQVLTSGPAEIRKAAALQATMRFLVRIGAARKLYDGVTIDGKKRRHSWQLTLPVETKANRFQAMGALAQLMDAAQRQEEGLG